MAENRDKFAAVDGKVYIAKCRRGLGFALLLRLIGISYILNSINFSLILSSPHCACAAGQNEPRGCDGQTYLVGGHLATE